MRAWRQRAAAMGEGTLSAVRCATGCTGMPAGWCADISADIDVCGLAPWHSLPDPGSAPGWSHAQAMHGLCAAAREGGHESGGLRALNHWQRVSVRVTLVMVLELIIWLGYHTRAPSHRLSTICQPPRTHRVREHLDL